MALALAAGAAACILSVDELGEILTLVKGAFRDAGGGQEELAVLFKAAGIALTGEYASQICRDAGEGALAQRVDFAVKISLFSLAAPMIFKTMKLIMELQQ